MSKLIMTEQATAPDTPASGKRIVYAKADGWYQKDDTGTEVKLTGATQLNELLDVDITSLADGELLVYNSTSGEWENQSVETPKWETSGTDGIAPIDNKELHIGLPEAGRESAFGGGDSYSGTTKCAIYTYNGTTFTDVTSNATSIDANKVSFPSNTDGNSIYIASILSNVGGKLAHPGLTIQVDTAALLGAGDIIFEFWNGSSWEEFNHMMASDSGKYLPYANAKFDQAGKFQVFFSQGIVSSWADSDPMSLGASYKWMRLRISGTVTTTPVFDRIRLHPPGRTEINEDGFATFYGAARPLQKFPLNYGTFQGAVNSPSDQDVYASDNLAIGMVDNLFLSNATDATGVMFALPRNICTSCPITIKFLFFATTNESSADVDFTVRWGLLSPSKSSSLYVSQAAAPTTMPDEKSLSGSYTMPANSQYNLQEVTVMLNIEDAIAERDGGSGDYIIMSFERPGQADAYAGNIAMAEIDINYVTWKAGGHL